MKLSFHKNHRFLFSVVFFGFVFLSLIIGVGPATWVQDHNEPLPGAKPLTPMEKSGLKIYVDEGCVYCHTQQVRPIPEDKVWGRPSAPGDYANLTRIDLWRGTPSVLGSERTGPDLSNVGKRRNSKIWNYIHLYNPRAVVKESVMPAFPWLFKVVEHPDSNAEVVPIPQEYAPKNGKVIPTQKAKELVVYLLSLKQTPLGVPEGTTTSVRDNAGEAQESTVNKPDGKNIFETNCAACHQSNGQGLAGAFPSLAGNSVVNDNDPTEHIKIVLGGAQGKTINGVSYSAAMPPWGDQLSDAQVAAVINYERTHFGNNSKLVTAEEVAGIRKTMKQSGATK